MYMYCKYYKCMANKKIKIKKKNKKNKKKKDKNQQQTQPKCDAGSRNRTWATAVGGERSLHCAIPAPQGKVKVCIQANWPIRPALHASLVSVATSSKEYFYSPLDGMLVNCWVIPSIKSLLPIYTPGWVEPL